MKKIFRIAICALLLFGLSVPAFAAETTVIKVTASEQELHRGDVVTFTVSISSENAFMVLGLELSYDTEVYEYIDGSGELEKNVGGTIFDFDESKKKLALTYSSGTKYSGTLMTFQLKVLSDADFESSTVSVNSVKLLSESNEPISHQVQDVKIPVKCVHEYKYAFVEGESTHTGTCDICGDVYPGEHKWGDGTTEKKASCTEKGQEKFTCEICSATKLVDLPATGHAWENDCDTTCENGCGKTRDTEHKFASALSSDKDRHWYQCEVCGEKQNVYDHTPGPEATETEDQTCSVCGYVLQEALGHTYDDVCDDTCNSCGEVREAPHVYNSEWRGSAEGHWHVCMACQKSSVLIPHEPGAPATEDSPQTCTECNYWIQFPLNHVHNFGDTWHCDDYTHWKSCMECFAIEENHEHEWDEGTVAEDGSTLYVCTVCNYGKTEYENPGPTPGTTPSDPVDPSTPEIPQDPTQQEDGFPWWIVAAAAALLMLIGIILLILEWRRSQKTNMHGKYSG